MREPIYRDIPCALARNAYTHSPTPMGVGDVSPDKSYRLKIYMPTNIDVRLGDFIKVWQRGQCFCGTASDSFKYEGYSLCIINVEEVIDDKS